MSCQVCVRAMAMTHCSAMWALPYAMKKTVLQTRFTSTYYIHAKGLLLVMIGVFKESKKACETKPHSPKLDECFIRLLVQNRSRRRRLTFVCLTQERSCLVDVSKQNREFCCVLIDDGKAPGFTYLLRQWRSG